MTSKKRSSTSSSPETKKLRPSSTILGISRSISACQRCRLKKIRCDQNFPRCSKCEKAGADCVGLDPATGREVPRSYVMHLEDRIASLEAKLHENGIDPDGKCKPIPMVIKSDNSNLEVISSIDGPELKSGPEGTPTASPSDSRINNIPFGRLMSTVLEINSKTKSSKKDISNSETENIIPAILPPKRTAQEFMKIYFAQANSQIPILHREEFIKEYFMPIYGKLDEGISLASEYTAINTSIFEKEETITPWFEIYKQELQKQFTKESRIDPRVISKTISVPSEYHRPLFFLNIVFAIASSTHLLQYHSSISDSFKVSALRYIDSVYASHDSLETLSGVLLLTSYSLMRPTVPGVWYVVGTALLICVDLGLHNESNSIITGCDSFTKDKRRRLFWCTYSLDRQICFYMGRPVGFPEECIDTPFPSELDDALIVPKDNLNYDYSLNLSGIPSYKSVSIAFFKMRRLQAEVQSVLYKNSEVPRQFASFHEWKIDIIKRLDIWKAQAPKTQRKMNCNFNVEFFRLNYYHSLVIICGLSPKNYKLSLEDFRTLSKASKQVISCYDELLRSKSINYTWAAVHNLFTAGSCYLYAIYNSYEVRKDNSLDELKKTTGKCINVLNSLIGRCDAAVTCRQSFEILSAAVLRIKYNDNVQGYTSKLPTNEELAENQPVGYLNPSLHNLVEDLESKTNEEISKTTKKIYDDDTSFMSKEMDKALSDQLDISKNENAIQRTIPSTFEWVSGNKTNSQTNSLAQIQPSQTDIDAFFTKLQDNPTEQEKINTKIPNSGNTGNSVQFGLSQKEMSVGEIGDNELGPFDIGVNENNFLSFDDKRVFDMINKMPIDSIWDEFFTTTSTANLQPPTGVLPSVHFDGTSSNLP